MPLREEQYRAAIAGRPWLRLLTTSAYEVPERLAEIDPALFCVYNARTDMYEVHEAGPPPGFTRVFSAEVLDVRVLKRVLDARWERDPVGAAELWAAGEQARMQKRLDEAADGTARELAEAARYHDWGRKAYPIH